MSLLKEILEYLEFLGLSGIQDIFFDDRGAIETLGMKKNISSLRKEYKDCKKCRLWEGRIKFVYGEGNPNARLMLIAEAPGANENVQGKPFVGRAGQLLTKMLTAINIQREDVFITNVVKCRPPGNRNPKQDEIEACSFYLKEQLEIIKPDYILIMGRVAANALLNLNLPLKTYRQSTYEINNAKVYVTYHPSALLRTPDLKKFAWADLQKLRDDYFNKG